MDQCSYPAVKPRSHITLSVMPLSVMLNEETTMNRSQATIADARELQTQLCAYNSAFEELDRPALKPLPERQYQYADWKVARVGIDYHIELIGHYYSVPHRFAREQVDVRYTTATIEVFHRGSRIAAHAKSDRRGHQYRWGARSAVPHEGSDCAGR